MNRLMLTTALLAFGGFQVTLALDWEPSNAYRSAQLSVSSSGKPGFTLLNARETVINFTNHLSDAKAAENQIRLNGSGVALGDVDNDGRCDIYFCRLEGPNKLYRNLGNWRFEEVTDSPQLACNDQYSTGSAFADLDADGDLDLLVTGVGTGTRLFRNDGKGKFTEALDSGLVRRFGATTLALADIEGDGALDLYVVNYRTTTIRATGFAVLNAGGKRMIRPEDRDQLEYTTEGRVLEHGEADILYRNDGKGHFTTCSWTDGTFADEDGKPLTKPPFDWGLSAMFRDLNGDGSPDLYVCNDFHSSDKIWLNNGQGRFRAIPRLAIRQTSTFSMAVDFGDLNRDGHDDIFVADMLSLLHPRRLMQLAASDFYRPQVGVFEDRPQFDRNTFQLNRGDGAYAEIASYAGLDASDWTWSAILLDVDLDGFEDLLCSTGHMFDTQDLDAEARIQAKGPWRRDMIPQKLLMFPKMQQPKVAFHNRQNLTFEEVGKAWGFDQPGVAHGMALADLDNDGDLDVVVNNLNAAAGLYRNDCPAPRVAVRLKGQSGNTSGIGARIGVSGGPVKQTQEIIAGGRYLSSDESIRVFAAGSLTNKLSLEVSWRSGKRSMIDGLKANRIYEIDEASASAARTFQSAGSGDFPVARPSSAGLENPANPQTGKSALPAHPLFEDVSHLLNHKHVDEPFDDFARQPLLPRKLSQLGPGVCWFDVNGDGWDDLIIGAGRSGSMAIFLNNGKGQFDRADSPPSETRDQTGIVGWQKSPDQAMLLAGSSNYEGGLPKGPPVRQFDLKNMTVLDSMPGQISSSGPLALADADGDGDLDLFVGGRSVPGRWPEPAASILFRNQSGRFEVDVERSAPFAKIGLVSGAIFTDLNADGFADLVLACEWGPLRVFFNENGRFIEATQRLGLDSFVGWWNGVSAGDFDNDGRIDLVASNWGLNSSYQTARELQAALSTNLARPGIELATLNPPLLYYGDFDLNGTLDLIEGRFDRTLNKTAPIRGFNAISQGLPIVRERFPSFDAFNKASVFEVGGEALRQAQPLRATWLATTVFLNRASHFEPVILPMEAQLAPTFGISVADFDGDGNEDLFLSQNFFPVQPSSSRLDAGRGLLVKGDGQGGFIPVAGQSSGVLIYGEGRGTAAADYDGDGRTDLVVAQNGAATKLFHNVHAKPGLRVRLRGPAGNSNAIGAAIRLLYREHAGPVREIHAGSGYWSQDGAALVFARASEPMRLGIRWPGGKVTDSEIPVSTKSVIVDVDGRVRVEQ